MKVLIPFLAIMLIATTATGFSQGMSSGEFMSIMRNRDLNEARAQKEDQQSADRQKLLEAHREYLGRYLPDIDKVDLTRLSQADFQKLYYRAYQKQGLSMLQAKEECQRASLSHMPPEAPAIVAVSSPTPSLAIQYAQANEIRRRSNEEAVREYPDVTNPDSPIAHKYLEIVAKLKATGNPLLSDPNSPLKISQMAGNELGIAPK